MPASVLILTLNEENNLPGCLESVAWSDDIVVFDSFSTDRTVEIARAAGARVVQRKFDNWSAHQNWAVKNIEFKHPWVLYVDADERCDKTLIQEMGSVVPAANGVCAFSVRRKDHFMDKWLKRSQVYPTWITRVFRPGNIHYERLVNPVAVVDGPTGQLKGHLLHHPFSHGITHWYARHNGYSDMEAVTLLKEIGARNDYAGIFSSDPTRRRKALKRLAYGLPGRPIVVLLYLLFFRMGFLDGRAGIHYAFMRATYEYMIDLKVLELRRQQQGHPV